MKNLYPHRHRNKVTSPSPSAENTLQKLFTHSAVIITIFTALLYFHGRSFYEGYLSYWGVGSLFSMSTEDALFSGVWTYLLLGVDNWTYVLAPFGYLAALYLLLFILFFQKPLSLIRRLSSSKCRNVINDHQKRVASDFFFNFEKVFYALLGILCFLLISISAVGNGKQQAEKVHQQLLSGTLEKISTVVFRDELEQVAQLSGYPLASTQELYAIAIKDGVKVIPFSRILSIQLSLGNK